MFDDVTGTLCAPSLDDTLRPFAQVPQTMEASRHRAVLRETWLRGMANTRSDRVT